MRRHLIIAFILLLFSLGLRFYQLPETMNFSADQGEFLLDSAKVLNGEPWKLIGIYVSSKPIENKYFFIGSQFSYFLAFWQWLLAYDPLKITAVFALFNSLAVVLTFLASMRWFGPKAAILAAVLYTTSPLAISFSKVIWNPTLQPFLTAAALTVLAFWRKKWQAYLIAGFLIGTAVAIEYGSILVIPIFLFLLSRGKSWLIFPVGLVLGLSNLILFDLRHSFYNSTLLIKYYLSGQSAGVGIHHILVFLPIVTVALALVFSRVRKGWIAFLLFALFFFASPKADLRASASYPDLAKIADVVASDQPKNFNVASIIDGDSRAHALRYLLSYPKGLKDQLRAVDAYNQSQTLYLIYYQGQEITTGGPYELTSFAPVRKVVTNWEINDQLRLAKLAPDRP